MICRFNRKVLVDVKIDNFERWYIFFGGVDILKRKRVVLERSMQSAVVSWRRQEVIRVNEFVEKGEELKLNQGATESRI